MKADLILKNGKYLDVKLRKFINGNIAIKDGEILGINGDYTADEEKDINGKYIVPGFIDGHIHLESSVISPDFMIPSCVPATEFDESAEKLDSADTAKCFKLDEERILGLAEMMNYPGVIAGDKEVLLKIAEAQRLGKKVDGHAPGLSGEDLKKYIEAGIQSDHECTTIEEAS